MPWPCAASSWWCALPLALRAREAQGSGGADPTLPALSFDTQVEALCGYFAHSLALMSGALLVLSAAGGLAPDAPELTMNSPPS